MGEPIEERMMAEYASVFIKPGTYATHVRLGQPKGYTAETPAPEAERQLLMSTLPEADLVVRNGRAATIYEFTVWRPQAKIGQLLHYKTLLTSTPGYEAVPLGAIQVKLVTGLDAPGLLATARELGIEVEIFRPFWLEQALAARRGRT